MPNLERDRDVSIYYEVRALEEHSGATPVVFLNGMTQTTQHWKSQGRALSERAPVLTYDARGQGETPPGDRELTLELHAEDLAALLDEIGAERAHLVGFSHGARVALAFAAHHPGRLDRLVLCSATAEPTALGRAIIRSWREVLELGGLEALSWAALPTILGEQFLDANERFLKGVIHASVQRNDPEGIARLLEAMIAYPSLAELAEQVQAPTLVVSGADDLLVEADGAARLAELCGGRHVELDEVAHTIPIEAPERFRQVIVPFLFES